MKTPILASLALLAAAAASFAQPVQQEMKDAIKRWELLRGNDNQRLSIDPKSIKARGKETSFKYLVDFRQPQGETGGLYRSIVVGGALQCKEKRIALRSYELYAGSTGTGVLLAQPAPSADEKKFQPVAKDSSDEDLYQRICEKKAPARR